jgi:LmbE family N-acetylglucosaminyl deacetylase
MPKSDEPFTADKVLRQHPEKSGHPPVRAISRRVFVQRTALAAAPVAAGSTFLTSARGAEPPLHSTGGELHIVCVGGHPDDPESGCAGTLARYSELGHRVTVVYLTRGERGISGKGLDEAAQIRSAECEAACMIMGAKALFAGQIDGATEASRERVEALQRIIGPEKPNVILTQWPIDTHMDHQVASLLTIRVWLALQPRPELYFFEVNTGSQSLGFAPNYYVDVTRVLEKKKDALLAHRSQDGAEIWRKHHEIVAQFRGREAGVTAAEALFHLNRETPLSRLPGV